MICENCKYFSMTTLGMEGGACWLKGESIYGESGEHAYYHVCRRVERDDFCKHWEPQEGDKDGK